MTGNNCMCEHSLNEVKILSQIILLLIDFIL